MFLAKKRLPIKDWSAIVALDIVKDSERSRYKKSSFLFGILKIEIATPHEVRDHQKQRK